MSWTSFGFQNNTYRQFDGLMDKAVDRTAHTLNTLRLDQAMDQVDMNALNHKERQTILNLTQLLTKDGDLSKTDTDTLIHTMNKLSDHSLSGMMAVQREWPYPQVSLNKMSGSPLMNALIGQLSGMMASAENVNQTQSRGLLSDRDVGFKNSVTQLLDMAGASFGDNAWQGVLRDAFNRADTSQLSVNDRAETLAMLSAAVAGRGIHFPEVSVILERLNQASLLGDVMPTPASQSAAWSVEQHGDGQATIDLDSYELKLDEKKSQLILKNKKTEEETRIWGDPHFDFNNDGKNDVDFWKPITLNLEDGTKITIGTKASDRHEGETLSTSLTITRADKAIQVTGLDSDTHGDLRIKTGEGGEYIDAITGDGLDLFEDTVGEKSWLILDGFQMRQVNQQDMDDDKHAVSAFDEREAVQALLAQLGQLAVASGPLEALLNQTFRRTEGL
jgi:hypothetical protein